MAQLKIVMQTITDDGSDFEIGPGTHGADCAEIIHAFGEDLGVIVADVWRPEDNCSGDCGKCETNYHTRMQELRSR